VARPRSPKRVPRSCVLLQGLHVATYTNNTTYFDHRDWLGTVRARSSVSGASVETCTSLPFGDGQTCTGTDWGPLHFTGQDWDSESNLTHFMFRQLSTTEGRWTSPDPAGMGAVSPGDPQTWNRYSYVENNPLSATDPLGLWRSDVFGTAKFGNDPFRDPGGAAFAAVLQQFYTQAGFGSPLQEGLTSYLSSIPGYNVRGGELYSHFGFYTPNPAYDPNDPDSLVGTSTSIDVDLGPVSVPANNGSWAWNFTKSFFTGFSVFGPKSDPRPSCFGQFLTDAGSGFVNSFLPPSPSPGEIVGVGTAMYDYPNEVGIVAEQHLAQYGSRISKYTIGEQAGARAGLAGLLANADYQGAVALVNEYGSASSGQCK